LVARINIRRSVAKAVNYNEAKVRAGVGELLLASGFGCDISMLGFSEKLRRFDQLNYRNETIKANTLHISLNFPQEEDLPPDMLQRIALDYMERIGFGEQPFLVYRHHDAGHPHIHIVTNTVRANGEPIDLHNIGKDLSEPAREAIEKEYGLITARGRQRQSNQMEGSHGLASKVQEITGSYRFTSLDELNAILAQFGMTAWPGIPGSALHTNRGLVYSRIDEAGNKIGAPIKSSDLATRPTLTWLERRFEINKVRKLAVRDRSARKLATALTAHPTAFAQRLKQRQSTIQADRDADGNLGSLLLIDHTNRSVFTPEELGLSTEILATRLGLSKPETQKSPSSAIKATLKPTVSSRTKASTRIPLTSQIHQTLFGKTQSPGLAGDFPIKKKKKKRRPY
jgi:hypothetical protein